MKTTPPISLIFSWTTLLLVATVSMLIGVLMESARARPAQPMTTVEDLRQDDIAVVRLEGIRNGKLLGQASGRVRITAGSAPVQLDGSGSFVIGDTRILTNTIEILVPNGMQFVASAKGKKYYPVTSKSGQNLSPANRIYFPDEESAKKAGYTR